MARSCERAAAAPGRSQRDHVWIASYGRFAPSVLHRVLRYVNQTLVACSYTIAERPVTSLADEVIE